MKVWLDDERKMPEGFDIHVFTAREAITLLATGKVTFISLDHDLGDEKNGTGYDVACYLEEAAFSETIGPLQVQIHSANPVGRMRMQQAIENAKIYWG